MAGADAAPIQMAIVPFTPRRRLDRQGWPTRAVRAADGAGDSPGLARTLAATMRRVDATASVGRDRVAPKNVERFANVAVGCRIGVEQPAAPRRLPTKCANRSASTNLGCDPVFAVLPALHGARLSRRVSSTRASRALPRSWQSHRRCLSPMWPHVSLPARCATAGRAVSLPALPRVLHRQWCRSTHAASEPRR